MSEQRRITWCKKIFPSIHPEGFIFVIIFLVVTGFLFWLEHTLGFFGMLLSIWCYYFFRNPERVIPQREDFLVAPACGIVSHIEEVCYPKELRGSEDHADGEDKKDFVRVSIFMSVFDCHVNRTPVGGKIKKVVYVPGDFFNASLDKASDKNERNYVVLETDKGIECIFVQIAGLVARRIVCELKEESCVEKGSVYGLIRFGSRVDIILPKDQFEIYAQVGQTMVSGETILGKLL